MPIKLHDWDRFVIHFQLAGIDVQMDTSDPDDGRISKNILHQYPKSLANGTEMNSLWKRIDFRYESLKIDTTKLTSFLEDNAEKLKAALRTERYDMIRLATDYLTLGKDMEAGDMGRLDSLVGEYRRSSLRHHVSRGSGIGEPEKIYVTERTESVA